MNERTRRAIEESFSLAGASHFSYEENPEVRGTWFGLIISCQFEGHSIKAYPSTPVIPNHGPKDDLVREMVLLSVLAIYKQVLMRTGVLAQVSRSEEIHPLIDTLIGASTLRDSVHGFVTPDDEEKVGISAHHATGLSLLQGGV